jgi:putative DNA primase/helicase
VADPILDALLRDASHGLFTKDDDPLGDLLAEPGPVGIGDIVRFDHLRNRWLVWNGTRWRPDLTRLVFDKTRVKASEWFASEGLGAEERKAILPIFNTGKKESVLKGLSARPGIAMSGNEWDTDGYLVGFENGIMDLREGTWYSEPASNLLVSKSVGIDWDPQATCPTFEWFLDDIMGGNQELVAYLKRIIGYSLIGTTTEQKFWMWVGPGANGKGVLARTLHHAFGDYAEAPADTLYMKTRFGADRSSAARPDLMRLQAARFAYMSEPPGGQFNEEMLKAHTGEDSIIARDLYGKAGQIATFAPTHKIVFLTNDPPKTDDVGISMSRRVRVIRFDRDYSVNPDRTLVDRLKAEKAGILNLAIREALAWIEEGMPEPQVVLDWSHEYIEENDPLALFLRERCEIARGIRGSSSALFGSYEDWAARNGVEAMSQTGFGNALGRRFEKGKSDGKMVYKGVRAKSAIELAEAGDDD